MLSSKLLHGETARPVLSHGQRSTVNGCWLLDFIVPRSRGKPNYDCIFGCRSCNDIIDSNLGRLPSYLVYYQ
jgi:hypothetical protein